MEGPHSNYFSTLCLLDWMKVYLLGLMMNCGERELHHYILEFGTPADHIEPYTSMAKELNFPRTRNGLLMHILLPKDTNYKMDANLSNNFKLSKWHDRTFNIMPLYFPNAPQGFND